MPRLTVTVLPLRRLLVCLMVAVAVMPNAIQAIGESIGCKADFSAMGQGQISIEIVQAEGGLLQARQNGTVTNPRVAVEDDVVRSNVNLRADPYSSEFQELNSGERSMVHLQGLLDNPNTRRLVTIPFEPEKVRRIKTYDLIGRTDKFGGRVLLEAYGKDGQMLGRVLRSIMVASCR